ncbi:hypothetical protein CCACVL1_15537 [Corchorus capsularis]|uniref:Uncharacterized protein n=1 Tax=Corchorus capsularis TaxID=210143 RepID=A0A1R3I225_COCAP|nr:hypothetical protein CCACVL1_15537 [Corchorus capsularis]
MGSDEKGRTSNGEEKQEEILGTSWSSKSSSYKMAMEEGMTVVDWLGLSSSVHRVFSVEMGF